jgi:hypothetical protein
LFIGLLGVPSAITFFWDKELIGPTVISVPALNAGPLLLVGSIAFFALLLLLNLLRKKYILHKPNHKPPPFSLIRNEFERTTKSQFNLLFGTNWNAQSFHDLINPDKHSKKISNFFSAAIIEAGFEAGKHVFDYTYDDSFIEPVIRLKQSGYLRISPFIAITDGTRILIHDRAATDTTTVVNNSKRYDMFGSISVTCGKMIRANLLDEIIKSKILQITPIPGLAIEEIEYKQKPNIDDRSLTETTTEFCVMQGIMATVSDLSTYKILPPHLEIWNIQNLETKKFDELTAKSKLAFDYLVNRNKTTPSS